MVAAVAMATGVTVLVTAMVTATLAMVVVAVVMIVARAHATLSGDHVALEPMVMVAMAMVLVADRARAVAVTVVVAAVVAEAAVEDVALGVIGAVERPRLKSLGNWAMITLTMRMLTVWLVMSGCIGSPTL